MRTSESVKQIAGAMNEVQRVVSTAAKNAVNPHFGRRYADLASVWDAIREAVTANGLSVIQSAEGDGTSITVITRIQHISGEYIEGALTLRPTKADPQGAGSAITYARRYALMSMIGICPDDDDGAAASRPEPSGKVASAPAPRSTQQHAAKSETLGGEFAAGLLDRLAQAGETIDSLRSVIESVNLGHLCTGNNPALWSIELQDRIKVWVNAKLMAAKKKQQQTENPEEFGD